MKYLVDVRIHGRSPEKKCGETEKYLKNDLDSVVTIKAYIVQVQKMISYPVQIESRGMKLSLVTKNTLRTIKSKERERERVYSSGSVPT